MNTLEDFYTIKVPFENGTKKVGFGTIVNDDKGRFAEGTPIRTSIIIEEGDGYIQTLNTRYEILSYRGK